MEYDHSYLTGARRNYARGAHVTGPEGLARLSVSVELTGNGPFATTLWTGHTGSMIFCRYLGTSVVAERVAEHLGDILTGYLRLSIPTAGGWAVHQGGEEHSVAAGHIMAIRYDRPFTIVGSPNTDALEIYIPAALCNAVGFTVEQIVESPWQQSELTRAATAFVRSAFDDLSSADPIRAARVDGLLSQIGLLALDDLRISQAGDLTYQDDLRTRALDIINAEYGDRTLTSDAIASRLHISQRSLFRAFEGAGTTVNQLIRNIRLDRAAYALADAESTKTIAGVARSVGSSSPEAFSRAFRMHFNESPSQFRARAARRSSGQQLTAERDGGTSP